MSNKINIPSIRCEVFFFVVSIACLFVGLWVGVKIGEYRADRKWHDELVDRGLGEYFTNVHVATWWTTNISTNVVTNVVRHVETNSTLKFSWKDYNLNVQVK